MAAKPKAPSTKKGARASLSRSVKRPVSPSHHRTEADPFAKAVGQRIRTLRKEREITFDALVGLSGLGRGYVSELERGLAIPSVATILKIAGALRVSVVTLLAGEGGDTPFEKLVATAAQLSDEGLLELLRYARRLTKAESPEK